MINQADASQRPRSGFTHKCDTRVLHEGRITLWRQGLVIDLWIVDHGYSTAMEVISYRPDTNQHHRLYLDRELLLNKMDMDELEDTLCDMEEEYREQQRNFDLGRFKAMHQDEHFVNYILKRITVPNDLLPDSFLVELRINFGDKTRVSSSKDDRDCQARVLDVLLDQKPRDLVPFHVSFQPKIK